MHSRTPDPEGAIPADPSLVLKLRDAYFEAILSGELRAAERVIRDAIDRGLPEATISGDIITTAMVAVGDEWEKGQIGVADEHLATDISMRMIALQREAFRVARERSSSMVLLAAVEGERHIVGLEMAASALLHAGFDVRMLGADVPGGAIAEAVTRLRPAVLGLTMTMPHSASQGRYASEMAVRADPSLGLVMGGVAAESALRPGPGSALCVHVGETVEIVDALIQRASLN